MSESVPSAAPGIRDTGPNHSPAGAEANPEFRMATFQWSADERNAGHVSGLLVPVGRARMVEPAAARFQTPDLRFEYPFIGPDIE